MFSKLKDRLSKKFPPGTHQMCYLYEEVMNHLGLSGIEGEEAASLVMGFLDHDCFLELKRCFLPMCPDMFEMVGPLTEESDGSSHRRVGNI